MSYSKEINGKKEQDEPTCSAEAVSVCRMNGWKRPEVIVALEEALQERKAEFDRLVDSEKTAGSVNDFFMEAVKEAGDLMTRRSG